MTVLSVAEAIAGMDQPPEREISEAELLSLAKRGDLDAFEEIVRLHERRIFALALRLAGNVADAQDATQEAFIRLYRKLGEIDSGRSAGPWLYSVTVNACRDMGRARRRTRLLPMDGRAAATPEPSAGPEVLCSGQEMEEQLRAGLAELLEKERAALVLREMEGMTMREVARILGSTKAPSALRSRMPG
ncbi:MAG: sigma-70 family RNA polymerase sigma factor [Acidobacteriia bacterium]|nr:sigma-70 family RNA polymerase sigma factor [Terriglobia bacterium]